MTCRKRPGGLQVASYRAVAAFPGGKCQRPEAWPQVLRAVGASGAGLEPGIDPQPGDAGPGGHRGRAPSRVMWPSASRAVFVLASRGGRAAASHDRAPGDRLAVGFVARRCFGTEIAIVAMADHCQGRSSRPARGPGHWARAYSGSGSGVMIPVFYDAELCGGGQASSNRECYGETA